MAVLDIFGTLGNGVGIVLSLDREQLRQLRLQANRLQPSTAATDVTALTKALCGIQAQDRTAAALAVQPRSTGLSISDVKAALEEQRSILRTWTMRGTLHLLATEDVNLLLPLLGPVFIGKSQRRYRQLGLDESTCRKAMEAFYNILSRQGALSRHELAHYLAEYGIPTEGQTIYHLVRRAALEGILCAGPQRDGEDTYVLLETWVGTMPPPLEEQAAGAELVRRYLAAHGPAGPEDFAAWSGLGMRAARRGFEMNAELLIEVEVAGSHLYLLKSHESRLGVLETGGVVARLLPAYDPYLLAYRSRELSVPSEYARRVHPGGGQIQPTLLIDGRAAGTWRWAKNRDVVIVDLFAPLTAEANGAVEQEVANLGRYLGLELTPMLLVSA